MILNTHPANRKEMARAISEHLSLATTYAGVPTMAYLVGPVTINKDGSITSDDVAILESLKPLLIERGWFDPEACPSHAEITVPLTGWTVPQLTSLIRLLYGKQYLLNRMMQGAPLYIEESFVKEITEQTPVSPADFEARVQTAVEAECIRGISMEDSRLHLATPCAVGEMDRWNHYNTLMDGILKSVKAATRVSITRYDDPENEKYHANSWLIRMGFGGPEHKDLRYALLHHLNGFAAFKSAEDMQAHKDKQAKKRHEKKEATHHD